MTYTTAFLVDWDNDGDFGDANEDISSYVKQAKWRVGMRRAFQDMGDENTASLVLNNTDGRFNPENSSSPLYGNILPHRRMQIEARDTAAGTTVLYSGWIEFPDITWRPMADYTGKYDATLLGIGAKTLLDDLDVRTQFFTSTEGGTVIKSILADTELATVSTDFSQIQTGLTTLDYSGDTEKFKAYERIEEITAAERGKFFFDRQGRPVWWNRHYLITGNTTSSGTVSSSSGDYKPTMLDYQYGRHRANLVRVVGHPRQVGSSETLWEMDFDLTVRAGVSLSFEVRLRRSNGMFAASGTLIITDTYSSGSATATVSENGGKALVTIDNSAGAIPAVLSSLIIEGAPTIQQNQIAVEQSDQDLIDAQGKKQITIDMGPNGSYDDTISVAGFELSRRKTPRGDVAWIEWVRKGDGSDNAHVIDWEPGTRLTLSLTELGHSSDYFVVGEEHKWSQGKLHEARLNLEQTENWIFWQLGVAGYSELGVTTILGF